ncbi:hypothetical protein EMCRGX_G028199 [Ephydatia muelleri]
MANLANICGLVLTLTSLQFCSSIRRSTCTIQDAAHYTVMAKSQQKGIKVTFISPSGSLSFFNGTVAAVLIPLERGVAHIYYTYDPVQGQLVYNSYHIIAVNRRCNPISLSFTTTSMAFLLCLNMTDSTPFVDFMDLDLGSGNDSLHQASYLSTWNILNTDYFSESLYIPDQANCPNINPVISSNIFVMDDLYAVAFITNPDLGIYVTSLDVLPLSLAPLCLEFLRLEYYGNNRVIMRCSNTNGIIYSLCAENAIGYDTSRGIPYPCSDWNTVVTHFSNGSLHVSSSLPSIQITLPFTIADALCVNGKNPAFVFALSNGTVLVLAVYSRELIEVTRTAVPRLGRWFSRSADPSIIKLNDGQIFMVVETVSGHISIKSLTFGEASLSVSFPALYSSSTCNELTAILDAPTKPPVVIIASIFAICAVAIVILAITAIILTYRNSTEQNPQGTSQGSMSMNIPMSTMMALFQNGCNNTTVYGSLSETTCEPHCTSNNGNPGFLTVDRMALVQPQLMHPEDVAQQSNSRTDTDDKRNDYINKARTVH